MLIAVLGVSGHNRGHIKQEAEKAGHTTHANAFSKSLISVNGGVGSDLHD